MSEKWIWTLVLGTIAALGGLFLLCYKPEEIEYPEFDGHVSGPYDAAERFLGARGFKVHHLDEFNSVTPMPPTDAVFFLLADRGSYALNHQLRSWVEAGGHLVVCSQPASEFDGKPAHKDDISNGMDYAGEPVAGPSVEVSLNADFPFEDYANDDGSPEDEFADLNEDPFFYPSLFAFGEAKQNYLGRIFFVDGFEPLDLKFSSKLRIYNQEGVEDPIEGIDNPFGSFSMDRPLGKGAVTLLVSAGFLANRNIGECDNAAYLEILANRYQTTSEVWFCGYLSESSFWAILWENIRVVILSLISFIALFLWQKMPRFGPIALDPPLERRSLMEHTLAVARFHWRMGDAQFLLDSVREALLERVRQRRVDWGQLEQDDLIAKMASVSNLSVTDVQHMMESSTKMSAELFTKKLAWMQMIRRSL